MKNRSGTGQLYKYKSDTGQLHKDMEEILITIQNYETNINK